MSITTIDNDYLNPPTVKRSKTAYQFDERGFYIGETEAQLNPMREDLDIEEYLLPNMCTWTAPPEDSDVNTYVLDFSGEPGEPTWKLYVEPPKKEEVSLNSPQLQIAMGIVANHLTNAEVSDLAKFCIDVLVSRPNI